MRPRIFSLMLTAFALVIVLGVGGMMIFFWLAVINFEQGREGWSPPTEFLARAEARRLGELYERDGSWNEVEPRFNEIERELHEARWQAVTLLDNQGRVVRSSGPFGREVGGLDRVTPGSSISDEGITVQTLPILANGQQVGALVVTFDGSPGDYGDNGGSVFARVARGLASAGLALAVILLGLATFFSGRISTPLRQLNHAAEAMAAGDLQVRVRPAAVREVSDLAQSFNRMADSLALADQQRRQLTADVAHELRTPLSIIKGRLEGIQDGIYVPDDDQIDGLLGEVSLLERLIEDLRLLAMADADQLALFPEATDPAHLLNDTRRSFEHQAAQRNVELRVEAPDELAELTVDAQRLAQVLGNLVGNALRYTPAGGTITLRAEMLLPATGAEPSETALAVQPRSAVLFEVIDTGAGIAAEDLPHIFDRFYRADRSRSRGSGGAGLGLAIARRIVEAHGGRIWAESRLGQGTRVRFSVPVG